MEIIITYVFDLVKHICDFTANFFGRLLTAGWAGQKKARAWRAGRMGWGGLD